MSGWWRLIPSPARKCFRLLGRFRRPCEGLSANCFGAVAGGKLIEPGPNFGMLTELKSKYVTLKDIAKRMGLTKSAISKALRNSHQIPLERRREIQRLARQMGYVPDPFFAGLAAHRRGRVPVTDHGTLAWVNHWVKPEQLRQFKEFNAYWQGASEAATQYGYRLDEVRWDSGCSPKRFERILLARGIEGVLIPPHNQLLDWEDFDWGKFSVLRFGMSVQKPDSNLVTADMFRATVMALQKIHAHGYRRIGITINEEFNLRLGGRLLSGYYYAQELLRMKPLLPPLLTVLSVRDAADLARQKELLYRWLRPAPPFNLDSAVETAKYAKYANGKQVPPNGGFACWVNPVAALCFHVVRVIRDSFQLRFLGSMTSLT